MDEPGDDDLIQAVAHHDPTALMALYDRHCRVAFGLAYRILDDAPTAEEVVQDAFLLVWRHAASFGVARGGGVRAWLLTIVYHRAIDTRRRLLGRREVSGLEAVEAALATPDAWGEVAHGLERDEVRTAVAALPAEQRRAIELAYFEGLTHREIAARTGTPLGTVKGRLRLGLHKLHEALVAAGTQRYGQSAEGGNGSSAATLPAANCE